MGLKRHEVIDINHGIAIVATIYDGDIGIKIPIPITMLDDKNFSLDNFLECYAEYAKATAEG